MAGGHFMSTGKELKFESPLGDQPACPIEVSRREREREVTGLIMQYFPYNCDSRQAKKNQILFFKLPSQIFSHSFI